MADQRFWGATVARVLLALALSTVASAHAQIVLRFAHGAAEDNPRHIAALRFASLVAQGTGGRITVAVSPSSRLADDGAALEGLVSGKIDLTANSQGPMAKFVPEYACLGLPYVFNNQYQAWRVLDGPIGDLLRQSSEAKGFVILGFWDNGFRHITNSKHPIREPADLSGLKIRTPDDAATIDFITALGGKPQILKFSELKAALKEGRVDGQENPLINIYTSHLEEFQHHISLTYYKYETTPFAISKLTWDKLAAPDRLVLKKSAAEATLLQRTLMLNAEDHTFTRLARSGIVTSYIDKAAFVKASKPVIDKWVSGPTGEFTKAMLAAAVVADRK